MRPTTVLVAALVFAPIARAQEPGGGIASPPSLRGQIAVSNAMTPAQKIATLEEALNKETDRRVDLDAKVAALTQENSRLASAREALARDKVAADGELARTRDALSQLQRDLVSLRGDYTRIARTLSLSLAFLAPLALLILALLGLLLFITRKLAVHVHDVPTLSKIHDYETLVAHLHDQLKAEKGHNAVLKERLTNLGIVD
jgi:septal ring factor EnvC (AmiA/AmiB activator)